MSSENHEQRHERIERQIAFIVDQQAKFSVDIDQLKEVQARTSDTVERLAGVVSDLAESVSRLEVQAEADRLEIREAIGQLITANENTRSFAQEIARLTVQTERRVTDLENRQ